MFIMCLLWVQNKKPITTSYGGIKNDENDEDNEEKSVLAAVSEKFSRHIGKEPDMTVQSQPAGPRTAGTEF